MRKSSKRAAIRVLPDHVINQIAAGEVIERPASVVKELVENSIDAGARRVAIEIADGGKSLVRVVDDGCGMGRAEVRLALTRHATSKLRDADDLYALRTMGFRGEALPSIAAVSRMQVTSRRRDDTHPAAWCLEIEAGTVISESEVGAPAGTCIEVRDLLYNLPVRQKFMRAESTESAHISDIVSKLALAHPDVHIRLRQKNRTTLDVPPSSGEFERTAQVVGDDVGLVFASGQGGGAHVRAYLGPPASAQKKSRSLQLFVGRRPVRDRGLISAVLTGYGELLGAGRYPIAVVFVDLDDGLLDVNVHPQKQEVRFADGQAVYAVVKGVVERAVQEAGWQRRIFDAAEPLRAASAGSSQPTRAAERLASYAASRRLFAPRQMVPSRGSPAPVPVARIARGSRPLAPPAPRGPLANLRYLGSLENRFLACAGRGELVLIDIAAAREHVETVRLRSEHEQGRVRSQRLLLGEPFADRLDRETLEAKAGELAALGVSIDLDNGTFLALPLGVNVADASELLAELLAAKSSLQALNAIAKRVASGLGDLEGREPARLIASIIESREPLPKGLIARAPLDELARRLADPT